MAEDELLATELSGLSIPPQLAGSNINKDVASLVATGGDPYDVLVARWRAALSLPATAARPATPGARAEEVLTLVGEAQARQIVSARQVADSGEVARLRGALTACCAALRIERPTSGELPQETVARLRRAAEQLSSNTPKSDSSGPGGGPIACASSIETAEANGGGMLAASAGELTEEDMETLAQVAEALRAYYETRLAMLLKRLDVLISTFAWSGLAESRRRQRSAFPARTQAQAIPLTARAAASHPPAASHPHPLDHTAGEEMLSAV